MMMEDLVVVVEGKRYRWSYDPTASPDTWWSLEVHEDEWIQVPSAFLPTLNRKFIDTMATSVLVDLDEHSLAEFCAMLEAMGASDDDFQRPGFERLALQLASRREHQPFPASDDWDGEGPLRKMGYSVAAGGPTDSKRLEALIKLYFEESPLGATWGSALSQTRLAKMANSIASFCRNEKRRKKPPTQAIAKRERDLRTLRLAFYNESMGFVWPDTFVF